MDPFLYLDRDTWVHRLDPRTKMFLLVGTFVLAFLFITAIIRRMNQILLRFTSDLAAAPKASTTASTTSP